MPLLVLSRGAGFDLPVISHGAFRAAGVIGRADFAGAAVSADSTACESPPAYHEGRLLANLALQTSHWQKGDRCYCAGRRLPA
jgi:hypothetical protein